MAQVRLQNLNKQFGSVTAVDDVNIELADGELLVFLDADVRLAPTALDDVVTTGDASVSP